MGIDVLLLVTGAFKTGIWIFLFVQGVRLRLMRHYPLTYLYFACQFVLFWLRTAAVMNLGPASPQYYWIYYGTTIPVDLLGLLILLRIYRMHQPFSVRRDWLLPAALPVFVAMSLSEPSSWGFRAAYVVFACLAWTGCLATLRNLFSPSLRVGTNLYWLTYGITVPAALQAFNQALYYLGLAFWPYDAFRVVNELTTAFSWCMIAYGMRRYDPPRIEEPEEEGDEFALERIKETTKALWRW